MNHWKPCLIAALALPLVAVAYWFARWDGTPSLDSNGKWYMIRGNLPRWASWLGTPDERLPGGTYEPSVAKVLERYGRFACVLYWLGIRNTWYGLANVFAKPLRARWPAEPGYYFDHATGTWWLRKPILGGRFQFKAGYRSYSTPRGIVGVPCLSITRP
jgi:hypothetical protein